MTNADINRTQIRYARLAGFMYLLVIVLWILGQFIVSRIEGDGSFVETAQRIVANEQLYRVGLCIHLAVSLFTIWLAVGLYVTVRPVDKNLAIVALLCRVPEIVFGAIMVVINFVVFRLHLQANHTKVFDADQLRALAELNSAAWGVGFNVSVVFFSMGSATFFYLFLKSRFIPRILSAWGIFASMLVTVVGFANLIVPQYSGVTSYGWGPIFLAEISTGLWLLIKGIKMQPLPETPIMGS